MSAKRSAGAGFTIIETLIVLAIAGIILLLVFEAIPTLVRNGRNNQRKQDVSAILAAVSHYELNNSGSFLDCSTDCYGTDKLLAKAKLTYYTDTTQVVVQSRGVSSTAPSDHNPNHDLNTVYVYNHQLCKADNQSATSDGAAYSDIIALYALEAGSGVTSQCQQL